MSGFIINPYAFANPGGGGSGYRYYRIYITEAQAGTDGYMSIGEMELRATAGGSDITSPGMATTHSTEFNSSTCQTRRSTTTLATTGQATEARCRNGLLWTWVARRRCPRKLRSGSNPASRAERHGTSRSKDRLAEPHGTILQHGLQLPPVRQPS